MSSNIFLQAYAKRFLVFALFFFHPCFSSGQETLDYLGIENGLSNNAVTSIYQDKNGFMWFGTYEGLNRYDGYEFKLFKNKLNDSSSLVNNWVVDIKGDDIRNIWIGTKRGISIYNPIDNRFSSLFCQIRSQTLRVTSPINDLEMDAHNNMLIGTAGEGLMILYKGEKNAIQLPLNGGYNYHAQAIQIKNNKIWVFIQGNGLFNVDVKNKKLILVTDFVRDAKCLLADNFNNLWIGGEVGLFKFNSKTKQTSVYYEGKASLSNNHIHSLTLDNKDQIWVGTDGGGVNIISNNGSEIKYILPGTDKGRLTSGAVDAVFQDFDERIWIGTLRGGINILDKNRNRFTTVSHIPYNKNSLINDFILSFCEDKYGHIWIGTDGEGISRWDRKNNQFTNFTHESGNSKTLSNNNVSAIVKDYKDNIWIGMYGGGINRFNEETQSFIHYSLGSSPSNSGYRNVWTLFEDSKRNLWASTLSNGPLYIYNRTLDRFDLFDSKLMDIITITEDKSGQIWAGTFSSFIKVDPKNKKHKFYDVGFPVRVTIKDRKGGLWIGTEGGGLLLFNESKNEFKTYSEKDGLPSNAILNILEDNSGNFWISTFNGLSEFDPIKRTFKNFYKTDGLQSNQFNYNAALKLSTGELLFGGIKGFNIFDPKKIHIKASAPRLLLTALKINNEPYQSDNSIKNKQSIYTLSELTLPYDKADISFEFAALDYSSPEKNSYAYYLEGWDKDWNYVGKNRAANYSRISEGTYYLRIKLTNSQNALSQNEKVIKLVILPPFWRTWWAYLFYILGAVGLLYVYNNYQRRQERLKYQVKLANLAVEKEKDLNEKKMSFFTHISHEFRTPLTLIIGPIKEFLNSKDSQVDTKELIVVYRNARRLLSLVDQLLHFRKSEVNQLKLTAFNIVPFCKEVYLCFQQQAKAKEVEFEFLSDFEESIIYADKEKIEIALFNLLSNAFKFTPIHGRISFSLRENAESLQIVVQDSGRGISQDIGLRLFDEFYQVPEKTNKAGFGIGLYLVKKFIESHSGTITYVSNLGEGSVFTICLLKGYAHFKGQTIHEQTGMSPIFMEELVEEVESEEQTAPSQSTGEAEMEVLSEKPSILLVDDNTEIRNYLKKIFQPLYIIYEANSGEEGLELVHKHIPNIVITDVMMGGMSGVELCAKIKEDQALNHIPVVLLTSSSSAEIKLKGIEDGADDFITKPFNKDMLIARIANLLKSRNNLQHFFYNHITFKADNSKVSLEYKEFLEKCITITEANIDNPNFSIQVLADQIGLSHSSLYKRVKSISGKSINEFIRFIKLRKAAELLINTDCNVNECAFQSGFNDVKYFRKQFNNLFGVNPSEYIKKYRQPFQKGFKLNDKISR